MEHESVDALAVESAACWAAQSDDGLAAEKAVRRDFLTVEWKAAVMGISKAVPSGDSMVVELAASWADA